MTGSAARHHEHHGAGVRVVHILRWFDGRPACGDLFDKVKMGDAVSVDGATGEIRIG